MREVAERVTAGRGFELVDAEIKHAPGGSVVRLLVDKEGGIGLEELQSVSEEVSAILDAEDPIRSSYTLEVSSPGLDRPLKSEADYRRFVGRLVKLSSYEPVEGRRHWSGRLAGGGPTLRLVLEKENRFEATITAEPGTWWRDSRVCLTVHPASRGQVEQELVGHALYHLMRWPRRITLVRHPTYHPEGIEAFGSFGFREERTLVWMRRDL